MFVISYSPKGSRRVSQAEAATAAEAYELVMRLEAGDDEIKSIKTPAEYEISVSELSMITQREGH